MVARILVVGGGAREHALADKLSRDDQGMLDLSRQVFVLGGNAGIAKEFECIIPDSSGIMPVVDVAKRLSANLVMVGSETYLADGLVDALQAKSIPAFGPTKQASNLEASKSFMKDVCQTARVATAGYQTFTDHAQALSYLSTKECQKIVIKADGLCGGKGALVCHSKEEAQEQLAALFHHDGFSRLGLKSHDILMEDFLEGSEISVFGVSDGHDVVLFPPMQDYKRLLSGDQGPNTGGMGSMGPLGNNRDEVKTFLAQVREEIFLPVLDQMRARQARFTGLLYAGLMNTVDGLKVLEFNVRFGDPETQSLLFATQADIFPLLASVAKNQSVDGEFWRSQLLRMDSAVTVVLASAGYPQTTSAVDDVIIPKTLPPDTKIFYGASHGRVLSVTARAPSIERAKIKVYDLVQHIKFAGMQYRGDIGSHQSPLKIH